MFSLLDVLKGWVSEARTAATPSTSGDLLTHAHAHSSAPDACLPSPPTLLSLPVRSDGQAQHDSRSCVSDLAWKVKSCSCVHAELTSTSSRGSRGKLSAAQQGADTPAKRVSGLLDSIDMELLSRAAFQCGAHARALLYFESHVRGKEKGTLNPVALTSTTYEDDDVSFFQVSHAALVSSGIYLPVRRGLLDTTSPLAWRTKPSLSLVVGIELYSGSS